MFTPNFYETDVICYHHATAFLSDILENSKTMAAQTLKGHLLKTQMYKLIVMRSTWDRHKLTCYWLEIVRKCTQLVELMRTEQFI